MVDQVKVVEIGADAIEAVLNDAPIQGLAYPPKLMHAVVAALGRHGFIIEDRYADSAPDSGDAAPAPSSAICLPDLTMQPIPGWVKTERTAPDWETSGDDA